MGFVNIAANETAFQKLLTAIANAINNMPPVTKSGSFGPFSANFAFGVKLKNTNNVIELTDAGTVHIKELDITYDPLVLNLGLDLPHIHVGGQCIIPNPLPWGPSCILRLPVIDIFGDDPDIVIPLDLSGLIVSEFSGEFSVILRKQVLAAKTNRTTHQAHFEADNSNEIRNRFRSIISSALPLLPSAAVNALADALVPFVKGNLADKWQFFLKDQGHDLDLIDIADTARNLLNGLLDLILNTILEPVPDILKDIVKPMLQFVIDLVTAALDFGDDIEEWLSSQLQTSIGLFDFVSQLLINFLGKMVPFYQFETPYPMLEDSSGLIPVLVPVDNVKVTIADKELVIDADIL